MILLYLYTIPTHSRYYNSTRSNVHYTILITPPCCNLITEISATINPFTQKCLTLKFTEDRVCRQTSRIIRIVGDFVTRPFSVRGKATGSRVISHDKQTTRSTFMFAVEGFVDTPHLRKLVR